MTKDIIDSIVKELETPQEVTDIVKALLDKPKTKLIAVNEIRKQFGLEPLDHVNDLTMRDKRAWLLLLDMWRVQSTPEHAEEKFKEIYA